MHKNLISTINGCFFENHSIMKSSYSKILDFLISSRKVYKNEMFNAKQKGDDLNSKYFNVRQLTFKVINNRYLIKNEL